MTRTLIGLTSVALVLAACSDGVTGPRQVRSGMPGSLLADVTGTGCATTESQTVTNSVDPTFWATMTWPMCTGAGYAQATVAPHGFTGPYVYAWQAYRCGITYAAPVDPPPSYFFRINNNGKLCTYSFLLTMTDRNGRSISFGPATGHFQNNPPLPPFTPPPPCDTCLLFPYPE